MSKSRKKKRDNRRDQTDSATAVVDPPASDRESETERIPKRWETRVNYVLLFGALGIVVALAAGTYFIREYQNARNADDYLARADAALEEGDSDEAIRLLSHYVSFRPQDVDALATLSELLEESATDYRQLVNVFNRMADVVRRDPDRDDVRRRLVDVAMKLGQFDDALRHISVLKEDADDDLELSFLEGQCHEFDGDLNTALMQYLSLIDSDGSDPDVYRRAAFVITENPEILNRLPELQEDSRLAGIFPPPEELTIDSGELVAERLFDFMVQHAQPPERAWLIRAGHYRARGNLERAEQDLVEARSIAPDDPDVLLASTDLALARAEAARERGESDEMDLLISTARRYAEQGQSLEPPDLRFWLRMSHVELVANDTEAAQRVLSKAIEKVPELRDNAESREKVEFNALENELRWNLVDVLLSRSQQPDEPNAAALRKQALAEFQTLRESETAPARIGFLQARIHAIDEEWRLCVQVLEASRRGLSRSPEVVRRVDLLLGTCYERLGNPDRKLDVFRRALVDAPLWIAGRFQLAAALAATGRTDEALQEYSQLNPSIPGIPTARARLLLLKQLRLPQDQRDWSAVERLLQRDRDNPNATSEVKSNAAIFQAELLALQQQVAEAEALLAEALEADPENPRIWAARAAMALRHAEMEEAERLAAAEQVLQEAEEELGDHVELRLAAANLATQLSNDKALPALNRLELETDAFSDEDRARLLQGLAQAYGQLGAQSKLVEIYSRLTEQFPGRLAYRLALLQLALQERDDDRVREHLAELRKIEGENGPNGNYFEALHLMGVAGRDAALQEDKPRLEVALEKPRELLIEAGKERPYWAAVPKALGKISSAVGDVEVAVEHYRKAVALGDRSTDVIQPVVQYLYQQDRVDEADQFLRDATGDAPALLTGELGRMAWQLAWQRGDFDEALGLAGGVAARSQDIRDQLIEAELASMRYRALTPLERKGPEGEGLLERAERLYRKAIDEGEGNKPFAWYSYLVHLARIGQTEEAAKEIENARADLPDDPPYMAPLSLATFYQVVGDDEQTEAHYAQAVAAAPNEVRVRLSAAQYFTRSAQFDKANEHVEHLLDPETGAPESVVAQANRMKALLLAASGSYSDGLKALERLKATSQQTEAERLADLKVQARLRAGRPYRRDRLQLISILEEIDELQPLSIQDRFQLARLYEATGDLDKFGEILRDLIEKEPNNAALLSDFALAMLNRPDLDEGALAEIDDAVERVERLEPGGFRAVMCRARLLAVQDKPEQAVPILEEYLETLKVATPERVLRDLVEQKKPAEAVAALAEMVEQTGNKPADTVLRHLEKVLMLGDTEEALAVLQRYISASDFVDAAQAELVRIVATVFERMDQLGKAEETYRRYASRSKRPEAELVLAAFLARQERVDEALDVCETAWQTADPNSVAAVSVGTLRTGGATPAQIDRVAQRLEAAVNQADDQTALGLLQRLADLKDLSGDYTGAMGIYRRILTRNDRSIIALNNLAWLQAYQENGPPPPESLVWIERAIELAGPAASLLDTRGTVHLKLGDTRQALNDLEQAIEELPQPAIYFHLAVAHLRAGDQTAAKAALKKAQDAGLTREDLHPLEQADYDRLVRATGT